MKNAIAIMILFSMSITACLAQEKSTDMIKLNQVLAEFEEAIINKDSVQFKQLFFHDKVAFIGRMSKVSEWTIKENYKEFEGLAISNCSKFIREICESEKKSVENFYNIKMETDGAIATISFDYSFYSGEKMIQWGNEHWNLVYADNLWLITDVVYSIRFPDVEEFPFAEKENVSETKN